MAPELITWIFTSIGAIGGMAVAGFFYLLTLVNKKHDELDKRATINAVEISHRVTEGWVQDRYYDKDLIDTHLKNIERSLTMLAGAIGGIDIKLDKIWESKLKTRI